MHIYRLQYYELIWDNVFRKMWLLQFIRLGSEKNLVEQLSEDMEVVFGMIENLAHKEKKVAHDCVKVSSPTSFNII